jgi:hypothetical protein
MASLSSILTFVAILAFFLALAAAGVYLYKTAYPEKTARFFTPKFRRLAFIERTHLDGGRKLLLVRRDNVEHLILIGGPIDLVIETGIQIEANPSGEIEEESPEDASAEQKPAGIQESWKLRDFPLASRLNLAMPALRGKSDKAESPSGPEEPKLPLSSQKDKPEDDLLELTLTHEAKPLP